MLSFVSIVPKQAHSPMFRWSIWLVFCSVGGVPLLAQEPAARSSGPVTVTVAGGTNGGWRAIAQATASMSELRRLLAMTPEERELALSPRPAQQRAFLRGRLREFDSMEPSAREASLQVLELQGYLVRLMRMPPADRPAALAAVPEDRRAAVQDRLDRWDRLPPELQRSVLEHERTRSYVLGMPRTASTASNATVSARAVKASWGQKVEEWRSLPMERRREVTDQFNRFIQLPARERQKVLEALPADERQRVEASIKAFESIPPAERQSCVQSLHVLSEMPPQGRAQLEETLERWKSMSGREQRLWREVTTVLPPTPPGFPTPPVLIGGPRSAPAGTNRPPPPVPGTGIPRQ